MPDPVVSRIVDLEHLFLSGQFVPAPVQRDYQWRTTHCRTLLADVDRTFAASSLAAGLDGDGEAPADTDTAALDADLATSGPRSPVAPLDYYMLGSLVLTPDGDDRLHIYDGLQRLTTLTVLVAVLRDLTGDKALRERLDRLVRVDGRSARLALPGRDATLSAQIVPPGEAVKSRRTPATSDMGKRVRIAAQLFRETIKPWPDARRDAFARFLIGNVYVDRQLVADPRLARQMFVTTNNRGKSLDKIDLFKGQLVDLARDDAAETNIVGQWNGARQAAGDQFGKALLALDVIERQEPQGEDCLNALADHISATRGTEGVEGWMQRMRTYVDDLVALQAIGDTPPDGRFEADIWRLHLFKWDQWRPLALLWFADWRRASTQSGPGARVRVEAAGRRFAALHRRCMAMTLAGFSPADKERIFARAIEQASRRQNPLANGGALTFSEPQLRRIVGGLRLPLTEPDVRLTLLRWYESLIHGDRVPAYVREITVEHILPRRPAVGSDWLSEFPDGDARFLACNALGNLAALDKARNEALRNADFRAKQSVLATAAADYFTLRDIPTEASWSPSAITARTDRLARAIEDALQLPPAFDQPGGRDRRSVPRT